MTNKIRQPDFGMKFVRTASLVSLLSVGFIGGVVQYTRNVASESVRIASECSKPITRISKGYQDAFMREDGQIQFRGYNPHNYTSEQLRNL